MMVPKDFTFNFRKTAFYGRYWQPKEVKGIIVLLHGMGGHSGRYDEVAEVLNQNQFVVVSYDNFGHGKTAGKRGCNPGFESLLDVITQVINKAKEFFPDKPVFLYGHSMGGNLVINYVLRKKHHLNGVIASSPFLRLGFEPPAWKMILGGMLQKIAPSITLSNELDPNHVSRNQEEIEKYNTDNLVHDRISPNYSIKIMETGKWAIQNAHNLQTSMFVAHGTNDKIIDASGSIDFSEKTDKALLKLYENGYHELHNDICKETFFKDVVEWLNSKI